jgi:hypothetical protein
MNRARAATPLILTTLTAAVTFWALAPGASAAQINVGYYSQQEGHSRAVIGAEVSNSQASAPTRSVPATGGRDAQASSDTGTSGSATDDLPPPYPTLPADSSLLQSSTPFGPGSFWYSDGTGQTCAYVPDASPSCYTVTAAGGTTPAIPPPNPEAIAADAADQLALTPGAIETSPETAGLTGAASWFWLSPAPQDATLSVSVGGEDVTVTAAPQIEWEFGDGTDLSAGPGVPYSSGPVPDDAVTHVYETRCLPGDQGNDPYVLPTCGNDGYPVNAVVTWQTSYQAGGQISDTGTLPTRTTTATIDYPVSEVRAFLTGGTAQ